MVGRTEESTTFLPMRADAIFGRIAKAGRDNSAAIVDAIRARRARRPQPKPRHVFTELHRLADQAAPAIERVFKAAVAATKQATLEAKLEILLAHRLEHALNEAIPWKEHGSVILQVRMKALVRTLILKAGDAAQRFQPAGFRGTIRNDALQREGCVRDNCAVLFRHYHRMGRVIRWDDWDESKHPRIPAGSGDPSGEFTFSGEVGDLLTTIESNRSLADKFFNAGNLKSGFKYEERYRAAKRARDVLIAFIEGGRGSLRGDSRFDDVGDITPREFAMAFDVSNPAAVQLAFARAGELVTKIDQETQRAISRAVANAIESGRPPRVLARDLRNMIGLNERQQDAINAMRDDGESEIAIAKATREALNYRALMISRTETIRASNLGQEALWQAAHDAGLLDLSQWTREYVATGDPPRECMVCGDLDGQTFAVGEPIHTEMGDFDGPPIHPNCRCTTALVPA